MGDVAVKKRIFVGIFGGFLLLVCISPAFGQQSGKKEAVAKISFSGRGNGPIEVRDAEGKILQILLPADLRLNKPPAHVVERERAYREKRRKEAAAKHERRKEDKRVAAEEAVEIERVNEEERIAGEGEAAKIAAEQGDKPKNPYRVRRRTIRRRVVEPETRTTGTALPKARH